jgi:PEP-CTERM motif-containing protein
MPPILSGRQLADEIEPSSERGKGTAVKRTLGKLTILVAVVLLASTAVYADNVVLASLGTAANSGETNSSGNPTITIDKNAAWADPLGTSSWVSYVNSGNTSGAGYVQVANGTTVSFLDHFTLSGTPTSGWLEVMADDSTSVSLNGHMLVAEASTTNNHYNTCSDFGIGCKGAYLINLGDYLNDLQVGDNVLQFDVSQHAGSSYGLDYFGQIDPETASVPEPGSLFLLATGFSALALRLRRRS